MILPYEREEKLLSNEDLLDTGRKILTEEAGALMQSASRVGQEIVDAAHMISRCHGRVVVSGLGKSGHVGRKTAATLTWRCTAATWVIDCGLAANSRQVEGFWVRLLKATNPCRLLREKTKFQI